METPDYSMVAKGRSRDALGHFSAILGQSGPADGCHGSDDA